MSFLNNLIHDPKYQTTEPRAPGEIADPEIIISPDTRRDNRIPPGQSRPKKWPVLDAHGTPEVDLATAIPGDRARASGFAGHENETIHQSTQNHSN